MSRADVPTLVCDRCGFTTQDIQEMGKFSSLSHSTSGGTTDKWDLCPDCWKSFQEFRINNWPVVRPESFEVAS